MNPVFDSLYRGRSEESLSVVAPYLFLFQHKTDFINWYMAKGWGDSWGVLIKSPYPLDELHKHFRKFLIVGTEDNQQLYFRFYDPRVMRIFLPSCDTQQLREFFGPIEYFVMEDADKNFALKCWLQNGILHSQKIKLNDFVGGNVPPPPQQEEGFAWQKPSMPGQPSVPGQPAMPAQPSVPGRPGLPAEPSMPARPSMPSEPSVPGRPSMPSEPSVPGRPSMPGEPSAPSRPSLPSEPSAPGRPSVPSEPTVPKPSKPKWNMFD